MTNKISPFPGERSRYSNWEYNAEKSAKSTHQVPDAERELPKVVELVSKGCFEKINSSTPIEVRSLTLQQLEDRLKTGDTKGVFEIHKTELFALDPETRQELEKAQRLGVDILFSDSGERISLRDRKIVENPPPNSALFYMCLGNLSEFAPDTESTDRKIDNASILHPLPPKFKAEQKEREPESSKLTEEQMIFNLNHNPNTDPRVKKNTEHSIASKRAAEEEIEEMEENRQTLEYQRMKEDIRHQDENNAFL